MNAPTFLAALESEGVRLRRDGGELKIKTRRGATSDPFIDLIRLNKTGLLATLAGEGHHIPWITADDLHWVSVPKGEVDETVPTAGWNGILPVGCAWSHLCTVLGPCPHVADGRCRCESHQPLRVVAEPSDVRKTAVA